jgi:HK97 family phage portal protein
MGVLTSVASALRRFFSSRSASFGQADELLAPLSTAGVAVSSETAMRCAAVHACVRVLADSVASLPLIVYRRTSRGRERAADSPLYSLLHDAPNPEHTSYEFREFIMVSLLLTGNAYALVERDRDGTPTALWPIPPDRVGIEVVNGQLRYHVMQQDLTTRTIPRSGILHVRGLSRDGIVGMSPIAAAREAIGLALAQEEAAARFWRGGAAPRIAILIPGISDPETWDRWRTAIERHRRGLEGGDRISVFPADWKVDKIGISPQDAEFIESRKFQVLEIARLFRVPPHKLGLVERMSYSSLEQQSIEFLTDSLLPWLRRIESALKRDVIPPWERDLYPEHLVDAIVRGDIKSRYEAYATARQWGWMSANEIRERENLNALAGEAGDTYLVPLNMAPVGAAGGNNASD